MRTEGQIRADATDERPFSNGSEYGIWASRHCYDCVNDDDRTDRFCPILTVAMVGDGSGPMWPKEWTRRTHTWAVGDKSGSYEVVDTCTEFEERRDGGGGDDTPKPPTPRVECDGQLDIVDAYVDTAVAELTPKPAEAATS